MGIRIYQKTGAGEDASLLSSLAFTSGIPGLGHSQFSYQIWLRCAIDGTPPTNVYANVGLQAVAPNGWSPDCKLWAGLADAYTEPVKPEADTSPPLLNGVAMVDFFSNRMVVGPLGYRTANAEFGRYLVLVAELYDITGTAFDFSGENMQLSYGGQ